MASLFRRPRVGWGPRRTQPPQPVRTRLAVEPLEERAVPATFTVTTERDSVDANDGFLSLREAIIAANAQPTPDTIVIAPNIHTLNLVNGELLITNPVTIQASGATQVQVVQSATGSRVFDVVNSSTQTPISVSLIGLTISGGNGAPGAGVLNNGADLSLINDEITGNNSGGFNGGGVTSDTRSTGSLTIVGTTIAGNSSAGGSGGGLQIAGAGSIKNSTISGNDAGTGVGGGINAFSTSTVVIQNSTVANNTASSGAGLNIQTGGTVTLQSTLLAANTTNDLSGNPTSTSSNNLINNVNANVTAVTNGTNGNLIGAGFNANLGPLALNAGGGTRTQALGSGSAAIGKGANPANLNADQNGGPRATNGAVDIGAVQASSTGGGGGGGGSSGGSGSSGGATLQQLQQQNAALIRAIVFFVLSQPTGQLLAVTDLNGDGFQDIIISVGSGRGRTIVAINGLTGTALFQVRAPAA